MARRSRSRQRGSTLTARRAAAGVSDLFSLPRLSPLTIFEDRRAFHPARDLRRAVSFRRLAEAALLRKPLAGVTDRDRRFPGDRVRFAVPSHVVKCVRRKERRQVMFAMGKTGKGARARVRRRDEWSNVHCR